jgi:hypothetical protein
VHADPFLAVELRAARAGEARPPIERLDWRAVAQQLEREDALRWADPSNPGDAFDFDPEP